MPRAATLAYFLRRNSCLRRPDAASRRAGAVSKKGWELRIVLDNAAELARLRALLRQAGIDPARAYRKRRKWVQPVYGRETVQGLTGRAAAG